MRGLSASKPQMGWEVADVESTVAALSARGVAFEEYDSPGLRTMDGVARSPGIIRARVRKRAAGSRTARGTSSASTRLCAGFLVPVGGYDKECSGENVEFVG